LNDVPAIGQVEGVPRKAVQGTIRYDHEEGDVRAEAGKRRLEQGFSQGVGELAGVGTAFQERGEARRRGRPRLWRLQWVGLETGALDDEQRRRNILVADDELEQSGAVVG